MIKRNAVFFTVMFALAVTVGSVSYTFYQLYELNRAKHINTLFSKYSLIAQIYHTYVLKQISHPIFETNLAMYDFYVVENESLYQEITKHAKVLKDDGNSEPKPNNISHETPYENLVVREIHVQMLQYHGKIFFLVQSAHYPILLEDRSAEPYNPGILVYKYATVIVILMLSFGLILHRLSPLRRIQRKISLFGEGDMSVSFRMKGNDEIALIANELELMKDKLRGLIESRTLFLRNIMHELKTPIAKGRIAATMLGDEKQKNRFNGIFERLENLIGEFALIEEISSGSQHMEKKEYRLIDLIDGAIDMAMVEYDAVHNEVESSVKVIVDYRLFTTAIKNMIDNAIKYSPVSQMTIRMEDDEIVFVNAGEPLTQRLSYYVEPFTKDHPTRDSFGLGLYIVDAILKSHGYTLAYERRGDENCFLFVPEQHANLRGRHKNR